MSILERRVRDCKISSFFLQYAKDITSQNGEDGIIEKLFELLSSNLDESKRSLFCCDIGAWNGKHLSNTYSILNEKNWSGLLIEADTLRYQELKELYLNREDILTLNSLVSFDGENSLSSILQKNNIKEIDFLTIDIDGNDYHIWKSLDNTTYKPLVVCIEFNPTIPNNVLYIQEPNMKIQHGSSLLALTELGSSLGYSLIATTIYNSFFVRDDLLNYIPSFDRSLDSLHSPSMCTDMFQTYDGELKFCGTKKLLWHRIGMNFQKMQVLKTNDRKFPFQPPSHMVKKDGDISYSLSKSIIYFLLLIKDNSPEQSIEVPSIEKLVFEAFQSIVDVCNELLPISHQIGIVVDTLSSILVLFNDFISDKITNIEVKNIENNCMLEESHKLVSTCLHNRADLVRFKLKNILYYN
jgi:hypothetical protein